MMRFALKPNDEAASQQVASVFWTGYKFSTFD